MDKEQLLESLRMKGFSEEIIDAFRKVRREDFVLDHLKSYAYEDMALPVESGTTLSQPYTIAFMLSLLEPKQHQKILEVGSGSGYVLSLISEIIKNGELYGIEINKRLAFISKERLLKDSNIQIFQKQGSLGLQEKAPFDRILISAAFQKREMLLPFIQQLDDPGILVAPVQSSLFQIKKDAGNITEKEFPGFAFVPIRTQEE